MCLVFSAPDRPRPMSAIQLILSWYTVTGLQWCPRSIRKFLVCNPWLAESDNAISSTSVLYLLSIVCLQGLQCTGPTSPITTQLPVCDLPSACIPYVYHVNPQDNASLLRSIHISHPPLMLRNIVTHALGNASG